MCCAFSEAEKLEGSRQQVKQSLKGRNCYLELAVPLEYETGNTGREL